MFKKLASVAALAVLGVISGCGGGSDEGNQEATTVLSVPDPATPVAADLTIGGSFEGTTTVPPVYTGSTSRPAVVYRDASTNTLPDSEIARAPGFTILEFGASYDKVKAQNLTLDTSSNEFAQKIIEDLVATLGPAGVGVAGKGAVSSKGLLDRLTAEEKALILRNPLKAIRTRTATQEAASRAQQLFAGGALFLDRGDAFRHAYWNWLMSECCTVEWATAFGTAHESEEPDSANRDMDLNNNMLGRRLFTANPTAAAAAAQDALLDYNVAWVNEKKKKVTIGIDYLVYLSPAQTLTVFDDGPSFDDIYVVSLEGKVLGETPAGSSQKFEFDQIYSGDRPLDIFCKLDGTQGGCGFEIILDGAMKLPNGSQSTPQIVIQQGQTHATTVKFPKLRDERLK